MRPAGLSYPWPHCTTDAECTMGEEGGFRCACPCFGCRAARWGISRSGIYRRRWQWWPPWGVTRWWLPRTWLGGDEFCNVPLCVNLPPLGVLILFKPGPMRTMPCAEDWAEMNDAERADYAPCGLNHGGRTNWTAHNHWDGACDEAKSWLAALGPVGR